MGLDRSGGAEHDAAASHRVLKPAPVRITPVMTSNARRILKDLRPRV